MRTLTTAIAAALLLLGPVGCADLDVANPNDPSREQVLDSADAVQSLIAGSFRTWYNGVHSYNAYWLSNAAFQSSSAACIGGNLEHSRIPRTPIINDVDYFHYRLMMERPWVRTYRALVAAADAVRALDENPGIGRAMDEQSVDGERRARAFARTVQALGHATLAIQFDRAFIRDETTDLSQDHRPVGYDQVMAAAHGYFQDAIDLAGAGSFTIPASWMTVEVTSGELVELLHSWRAIFRAALPRSPEENVAWAEVLSDLDRGLTGDFDLIADWSAGWYNAAFDFTGGPNGYGAETYFIIGMADQSGSYQRWLADPAAERTPWFGASDGDDPFLIQTPDTRFPRGATIAEQIANPGDYYVIPTESEWGYDVRVHFAARFRGTWRWSYYYYPTSFDYWFGTDFTTPLITRGELDLLRAEALLATDARAAAADLINVTRTAHGLAATDGTGANADCVPRLPDGSCGGLMEMLKWEKRLETKSVGLLGVGWFWDSRRWGDLYLGTPLQLPIPAGDLETLQRDVYTFGGANEAPPSAAAGSSYRWPGELAPATDVVRGCAG